MSQRYATIPLRCRACQNQWPGPTGTDAEVWGAFVTLLQGKAADFKGKKFYPFHTCSTGHLGAVEPLSIEYRYGAPYGEPGASITDPAILAAMDAQAGHPNGYDFDMANAQKSGGGQ